MERRHAEKLAKMVREGLTMQTRFEMVDQCKMPLKDFNAYFSDKQGFGAFLVLITYEPQFQAPHGARSGFGLPTWPRMACSERFDGRCTFLKVRSMQSAEQAELGE